MKQVQAFLGLCNYYIKFIRDFAKIAHPLYSLLEKKIECNWDQKCQEAFYTLKEALISEPILRQPDMSRPFIIHTDASNEAVGAILSHTFYDGN